MSAISTAGTTPAKTRWQQFSLRLFGWIQKLNNQRHLHSIRVAFISTMPIMILGAYAVVINQLPIPAYQEFMLSLFGHQWDTLGVLIYNGTTQIVTLMVVFAICSNLVEWYNTHQHRQGLPSIGGMIGLACYAILTIPVFGAVSLPFSMTGVTGLFVAMASSVISAELYVRLASRRHAELMSDDPSPAVPQAFAAVIPTVVIVVLFALVRGFFALMGVEQGLDEIITQLLSAPFANLRDSMGTAQLFNISSHLMGLFGIHGNNVLDDVVKRVLMPAMHQNTFAVAAGMAPPNIVTKTLFDAFVYIGGSGATLSLLIALLIFGRSRSYKRLFRYAAPNSIFNINEPLIFGIPIVLNPVYALPFVLTPVVNFSISVLAMKVGLVPYTIAEVSWATPIFFSGYAATGSLAGSALQLVNLAVGVLIYAPFVRLAERMTKLRFDAGYDELSDVVTCDYSAYGTLTRRVDEVGAVARRIGNQLQNNEGRMFLLYQPIVDVRDHTLHSVEALLRWEHPDFGLINPMVTVALAEETERINELGLWIMEQAIEQRAIWTMQGVAPFHVSVNVSTHQLDSPAFADRVEALLEKHGVDADLIQIEITEAAALIDDRTTQRNINKLNQMGVTLAMDDFGVGHSSLLYLRTQPITTLKIDGCLAKDIVTHSANLSIIATIQDLCRLMHIEMVVEYVENKQQLDKLTGIGVSLIQGYYFSKPILPSYLQDFIIQLEKRALTVSEQAENGADK